MKTKQRAILIIIAVILSLLYLPYAYRNNSDQREIVLFSSHITPSDKKNDSEVNDSEVNDSIENLDRMIEHECTPTMIESADPELLKAHEQHWKSITSEFINNELLKWYRFIGTLELPPVKSEGQGVLYLLEDDDKSVEDLVISIRHLLSTGYNEVIEVWHYSDFQFNTSILTELSETIRIIELSATVRIKYNAILESSLDEILVLEPQTIVLSNPSFLFTLKEFKKIGGVFWKDFWKTAQSNPIWGILNYECLDEYQMEAGQVFFQLIL